MTILIEEVLVKLLLNKFESILLMNLLKTSIMLKKTSNIVISAPNRLKEKDNPIPNGWMIKIGDVDGDIAFGDMYMVVGDDDVELDLLAQFTNNCSFLVDVPDDPKEIFSSSCL